MKSSAIQSTVTHYSERKSVFWREKSENYSPISLSKQKWHGAVPSVAPKTDYLSSAIGPARNEYFSIWDMAETESLSA